MARRRQRKPTSLVEKIIDFINKQSKNKEGVNPMFYSFPPMMMPPGQNIDPIALHNFINEQLEKQKKDAEEKKKKESTKGLWPFTEKFTFLQTVLITMTLGLVGGYVQLKLLYAFKDALLKTIQ